MRIGRHMPTGSQPVRALQTARAIGCEAVQIFVTNPRGWREPEAHPAQETAFRAATAQLHISPVVVHATYLINLASPRDDFAEQSVRLLRATLARAERFGAASVVLHIGSHGGAGEAAGLVRLAEGIRRTLEGDQPGPLLLLENDVGAGNELGYRFENLAAVLDAVPEHAARLGVCLDTAHLWGAGFDIGTAAGVDQTLDDAARLIGLARVHVLHLNDTRFALGSHRDVHARLGEGIIGTEGLQTLLRHPGLAHASVLLETPIAETAPGHADWPHDQAHLRRVYALAGRKPPRRAKLVAPDVAGQDERAQRGDGATPATSRARRTEHKALATAE
ncbi:MAG TPA: deoxyribonuclease IV [Ktedonobacterales bacterium]|nr:deoxyribonuclease IV [Ktedonobacterales bacterium]